MARPSLYSEKIVKEICTRLADGESLRDISLDSHMPTNMTIYNWLQKHEEFFEQYTRAREMQGYTHAAMAIEAATKAKDAGLGRLAYDALKWHASKLVPKVYGDKTEVAVVGANGGPVQSQSVTVSTTDPIEAARVYQKVMSES
jgi:terminase small subunit-like protein